MIYLIVVILFMVMLAVIGIIISKGIETSEDWMVAGKSLGVIPMAIARGEGAEVYAPLGQVIMGGLTTSTFITLVIMPIFYFRSERRRMNRKYQIRRKK